MAGTVDGVVPLAVPGIERLEEIGHGGFSVVYRGWQPAHERWVAVKVLREADAGFAREARALGSLSEHPNVVALHASGEVAGHPYLVMPYLSGGSLQGRIDAGAIEPHELAATIAAVAGAVQVAHERGVLHRDIKPANILFTSYGVPQLADFGIARMADSTLTQTGSSVAATVAYTAPEVLSGERATVRSDVYALGATLDAALRGGPAFAAREGEPAIGVAVRVVRDEVPPLRGAGVPAGLAAIAARTMAKDPADRPQSAEALRAELASWAARPGATAPATTRLPATVAAPVVGPATVRPRRDRRRAVAAAAILAVLAAGGAAAALSGHGTTTQHPATAPAPSTTAAAPSTTAARPSSTTAAPTTAAPTTAAPPSTASPAPANGAPPSAGGATNAATVPPATLQDAATRYYALVNQHALDQSWTWLSPAFQGRIGNAYYRSFWNGFSSVAVASVSAAAGHAQVSLRETSVDGTVTNELDDLGYIVDPAGHLLIDTDQHL